MQSAVEDNLGPNPKPTKADLHKSSINIDICIFCAKARRKLKGKHVPLYSIERVAMRNNLELYKEYLEDTIVYKHLQSSVDVKAHRICRVKYLNSMRMYDNKPKTEYHKKLQYRDKAFQEVCFFIDENIVKLKKCFFFSFLCQYHTDMIKKLAADNEEEFDGNLGQTFFEQKLRKKIRGLTGGYFNASQENRRA